MNGAVTKRLFVGGLSNDVSSEEICERFSRFGKVSNLSLKTRTDELGNKLKSFAHLDLEGEEANIKKCINTYQNAKWKGTALQLQYAKESSLKKLEKEIKEAENQKEVVPEVNHSRSLEKSQQDLLLLKGHGVPGTPVPGKKDWVVGKYGRVLPVLKLKKSYKIPMEKYDPSKHCHAAKVFKDDTANPTSEKPCAKLTWQINTPDTEITRKRKGEFPDVPQSSKKPKVTVLTPSDFYKKRDQLFQKMVVEEVEVVKAGLGIPNLASTKLNKSNRFDSDAESDSEDVAASKNSVTGLQAKKAISQPTNSNIEIVPWATNTNGEVAGEKCLNKNRDVEAVPKLVYKTNEINVSKLESNRSLTTMQNSGGKTDEMFKQESARKNMKSEAVAKVLPANPHQSMPVLPAKKTSTFNNNEGIGHGKIPEFKGLGMIGLLPETNHCVPNTKSEHATESHLKNPIGIEKSPMMKTATTTIAGKRTHPLSVGSISSPDKPNLELFNLHSGISDVGSKKSSEAKLTAAGPNHTLPSLKERPAQLTQKSLDQTKKIVTNSGNKKSLPLKLSNSVLEESGGKNYDSSSSADTDEIIAQCKKRKSITVSPKQEKELLTKSNTVLKNPQQMKSGFGISKNLSFLDHNLGLSEYTAAIPDSLDQPASREKPASQRDDSDVSDSDLDSNDFALVARKLAQKAAAKTAGSKVVFGVPTKAKGTPSFGQSQDISRTNLLKNQESQSAMRTDARAAANAVLTKARAPATNKPPNASKGLTKQATDNEKRLQTIWENMKLKQGQQGIGHDAFKNVDSKDGQTGTRLVFSSSDDDSSDNEEKAEKSKKTSLELFNSSSDDGEDEDYGELFKSKPHFEGEKGEKLMKLDKKIGDPRFKLDAKFAVSDSEDDEEDEHPKKALFTPDVDKSLEDEKAANLKVLENVIGKTALDRFSEKLKRNTKHIVDMNAVRFDPTKIQTTAAVPEVKSKPLKSKKPTIAVTSTDKKSNLSTKAEQEHKADDKSKTKDQKADKSKKKVTFDEEKKVVPASKKKENGKSKHEKPQLVSEESAASTKTDSVQGTKTQLSSSLVNLFNKKKGSNQNDEEEESFSLLQQFDQGGDDSEEDDRPYQIKRDLTSQCQAPLSALFKKGPDVTSSNKTEPVISSSDVQSEEEESSSELASASDDTPEEEGTDAEESAEQEERVEPAVTRMAFPVDEDDSEESMDEDNSSNLVADSKNEHEAEFINAGRMDVRYTKDQWLQRWEDLRPALVMMFKRKHKDALRNKRKNNEMKRKKDFLKNSKRHRWTKKRVS